MAKNAIRTSEELASKAGKALRREDVEPMLKQLAAAALENRKPATKKK